MCACSTSSCPTVQPHVHQCFLRGEDLKQKLTIQTQSTPQKKLASPFAVSDWIRPSRPTLPLSSMPSKQNRTFTGSSSPSVLCASSTFSHPRIGPLSSVDPRPISLPVSSSTTSLNGSESQPSLFSAYKHPGRTHASHINARLASTNQDPHYSPAGHRSGHI